MHVPRAQTHRASVVAVGKTWFCRFPRTATDALCEQSEAIGSYLGMSAATATRMLAKLRSQGSIAIHTDGVDVLHEASLHE